MFKIAIKQPRWVQTPAAKKRYDHATAVLKELLDKRDAIRKDEILSAIVKSGRSYEEIMNFLNVEETEREIKE